MTESQNTTQSKEERVYDQFVEHFGTLICPLAEEKKKLEAIDGIRRLGIAYISTVLSRGTSEKASMRLLPDDAQTDILHHLGSLHGEVKAKLTQALSFWTDDSLCEHTLSPIAERDKNIEQYISALYQVGGPQAYQLLIEISQTEDFSKDARRLAAVKARKLSSPPVYDYVDQAITPDETGWEQPRQLQNPVKKVIDLPDRSSLPFDIHCHRKTRYSCLDSLQFDRFTQGRSKRFFTKQ